MTNFLVGLGYNETIHYSFHNPEDLNALRIPEEDPLRKQIRIRNPLSEDQSVLRSTLLSSLIHTLRYNIKRSLSDIRIFEMGRVFEPRESGLPNEKNRLSGIIAGKERPLLWDAPPRDLDFFDLKGDLCALFEKLGLGNVQFSSQTHLSFLHPGKSACMDYGDARLGVMGEIHPSVLQQYDLSVRAQCFEIDLDLCLRCAKEGADYVPISRFPSVERDIALILSEEIPAQAVADEIRGTSPDLIREIRFFDLYRGQPIPSGKKSLAFSIRFQAADRTLTDTEINEIRDGIVGVLNKKFQATLRE
jgi:phenylalanyl-tRNA synthetase beta chain